MSFWKSAVGWVAAPWLMTNKYVWDRLVPKRPNAPQIPGRPVQVAAFGKALPVVWGQTRISGGLIYLSEEYQRSIPLFAGANGYWTGAGRDAIVALCEGPIVGIGKYWADKYALDFYVDASANILATGTVDQAVWTFPPEAKRLVYPYVAYVGAFIPNDSLGTLPQMSYEVKGLRHATGDAGTGDADPAYVLADLITDARVGAGAPFSVDVDLGVDPGTGGTAAASYRRYVTAESLWLSPAITDPRPTVQHVSELLDSTNATALWTPSGALKIIPLGDTAKTGNSVTFTPVSTVQYALTRDDILGEIELELAPLAEIANIHPVEYLDRSPDAATLDPAHKYNVAIAEDPEVVDVAARGEKRAPVVSLHSICRQDVAIKISRIRAQQSVSARRHFGFSLPWRFCRLQPFDLVSLTDARYGLSATVVRIESVKRGDDFSLRLEGTEMLQGSGFALPRNLPTSDGSTNFGYGDTVEGRVHQFAMRNWTLRGAAAFADKVFHGVAKSSTIFCAVGATTGPAVCATSPDAVNWTSRTGLGTALGAVGCLGVCHDGTRFIAVGATGACATATDPTGTWTARTMPGAAGASWYGVAANGTAIVAVGGLGIGGGVIAYSTDGGATWASGSITGVPPFAYSCVAWSPALGLWVAAGSNGDTAYSSNGSTWTAVAGPAGMSGGAARKVRWGTGKFVAVGHVGTVPNIVPAVMYSANGTSWTHIAPAFPTAYAATASLEWTGAVLVASGFTAGGVGCVWTSFDAINWAVTTDAALEGVPGNGWHDMVWSGRSAVAVGDAGVGGTTAFASTVVV